ncbi:MAG: glycosyltransferase [Paracoccaceae bacterium]|nr:glycosyltransferase [Paracoccaceae bacterium]
MRDAGDLAGVMVGAPSGPGPTVLLATLNGAGSLQAQLDSYLVQTVPIGRLMVSDDGSSDGTLEILARFAAAHPAIAVQVMAGPGRGAAQNFLHLLRALPEDAGPVLFSDQDDVWLPGKVAHGLRALAAHPGDVPVLVGARSYVCDSDLGRRRLSARPTRPPSFRHALVQSFAGGNTMICNAAAAGLLRAAAQEAGRVVMHDWWAYQIVSGVGGVVVFDPVPQVLYRQHAGNRIGANLGWAAGWRRLGWLMRGRFRRWNAINLRALRASAHRLTPENREVLAGFENLRRSGLIGRVILLRRLGLVRRGMLGRLSLWVAVILGRV